MVKKVFSNTDDVIHVWAQQKQEEGRNGSGSISFEGTTLVSYRTPVARFYSNDKETIVLITTQKYSVTTSQQLSSAAFAVKHHEVLRVLHIGGNDYRGRAPNLSGDWHEENIKDLQARYEEGMLKLSRAKTYADSWERELTTIIHTAKRYCEFFGLHFDRHAFPPINPQELLEAKQRAQKAIKEKSAATAAANKHRQGQLEIILINCRDSDGALADIPWDWKKFATKEQQKTILDMAADYWQRTGAQIRGVEYRDLPAMLRVKGDEIETSWRASFPIDHGKKAFAIINRCREAKTTWHTNGHTIHLGHYAIDSINDRGDVVAGCHTIYWSAIETVAKQLNLI